ncbi:uncharacterized protein LOC115317933 [Ixodes scapularis]|uniref:uncharacterized protein LOC115317933 n=1 Tax=Ixodes scapularis TaxID=6945 RepID=UPI001A9F77C4|nr:uncharacterized protein LOC115317933 [Ixodes scapularis]
MPAASLLIVIAACLAGQITCAELDPDLKRCPDEDFENPGYSPTCTYSCYNGPLTDLTEYWGNFKDGTACITLRDDPREPPHIGTCKNGTCVQYDGPNIQQVWSQLPELQAQFHNCQPVSTDDSVENCLYVCQSADFGYSYGIYKDRTECKLKKGGLGICLSGFCHGNKYFPTTDNDTLTLL